MRNIVTLLVMLFVSCNLAISQTPPLTVEDVFNSSSRIEGFQKIDYIEDDIKFPKNIGKPTMIVHGNAGPREEVLSLLAQLPAGSMVYDETDESGRFDRLFLDTINNNLLYVHIGINGNDSVLILFKGGKRKNIEKFFDKLKREAQQ